VFLCRIKATNRAKVLRLSDLKEQQEYRVEFGEVVTDLQKLFVLIRKFRRDLTWHLSARSLRGRLAKRISSFWLWDVTDIMKMGILKCGDSCWFKMYVIAIE